MPKGYMQTLSPVNIASSDIRLSADRLEAIDNGEQFRFTGSVRLYVDAALLNKSPTKAQDQTEPRQQGACAGRGGSPMTLIVSLCRLTALATRNPARRLSCLTLALLLAGGPLFGWRADSISPRHGPEHG